MRQVEFSSVRQQVTRLSCDPSFLYAHCHRNAPNSDHVLTLDIEDHLGLHRAHIIGGCAAILSCVCLSHPLDLQHATHHHDVGWESPAHFAPLDGGLGVTDGLAFKLHRVPNHDGLN